MRFLPILAATLALGGSLFAATKPNILIILADDAGFSDIGCYGGEIATPNLDALAANGLRFTQFYNTARCWPTRAAILTGYYPQEVAMDPPRGTFPPWTTLAPSYLKPLGYRCYHSGKWHVQNAPRVCADAGFDHSYKLDDHDRHFAPRLHTLDDAKLPPVQPGSGYYTTTAIAEHAIEWLKEHAEKHAGEPFFEYLAFTSPHFPIQAPEEDIAKYRATYTQGWEKTRAARYAKQLQLGIIDCALAPIEPQIKAPSGKPDVLEKLGPRETLFAQTWDSLTPEQKKYQAEKEAVHAAMVDRIDREVGRVIAQLKAMGAFENTIIFFLSDNGASAEVLIRGDGNDLDAPVGSEHSFLCLGPGGSTVSNTPFRRHKIWTHEGGISTPLIAHWPAGIGAHGELRRDPGHVVDLLPTMIQLAGGEVRPNEGAPPFPGRSLVASFASDSAAPRAPIYFSHEGNRGLRDGDWKLVSAKIDADEWELYHVATDRSETHNLASELPEKVRDLAAKWEALDARFKTERGPDTGVVKKPRASE